MDVFRVISNWFVLATITEDGDINVNIKYAVAICSN